MKVNVGLSKKVGLPDYGSLGASCHVELELDGGLLQNDLEAFQRHVKNAFVACRQAVHDQLARENPVSDSRTGTQPNGHPSPGRVSMGAGNGHETRSHSRRSFRPATQSQARAIRTIANRQQLDLAQLLGQKFGVSRPEELSLSDASSLIDELKAPAAGGRP
jgi:hypothetical protein